MGTTLVDKTFVATGYGHQADAFQRGREAAQTAKSQLRAGPANLVLTFGPDNVHFKDLIEGVRLVTGEEALIGIPVRRVISKDAFTADAAVVLAIQSSEMHFSFGAVPVMNGQFSSVSTSTLSQIRKSRGNIRKQFNEQGLLIFDNTPPKLSVDTLRLLSAEAGLTNWSVGVRPRVGQSIPLICGDKNISEGLIAVECLSPNPWGVGEVVLEEFIGQGSNVYLNAIKSAIRNALAAMTTPPSFGLIFFNFPIDDIPSSETDAFFETAGSIIGDTPIVGFSTDHVLIKGTDRAMTLKNHSISVLLGPQ
jgi:hypothetical protein